jgi:hypothetical protein
VPRAYAAFSPDIPIILLGAIYVHKPISEAAPFVRENRRIGLFRVSYAEVQAVTMRIFTAVGFVAAHRAHNMRTHPRPILVAGRQPRRVHGVSEYRQ